MPSRTHISPPTQQSDDTCRRHVPASHSPTLRTRCSMSRVNAAWGALYTCTRYTELTARMVEGSGRAMDALPPSDLAAYTPIR